MNTTIAHRPHVQVPWLPIIVVLAIAAAAALVVALGIQVATTTTVATSVETVGTAHAPVWTAGVPKNRSPVARTVVLGALPATAPPQVPAPLRKSGHTPWQAGGGALTSR